MKLSLQKDPFCDDKRLEGPHFKTPSASTTKVQRHGSQTSMDDIPMPEIVNVKRPKKQNAKAKVFSDNMERLEHLAYRRGESMYLRRENMTKNRKTLYELASSPPKQRPLDESWEPKESLFS